MRWTSDDSVAVSVTWRGIYEFEIVGAIDADARPLSEDGSTGRQLAVSGEAVSTALPVGPVSWLRKGAADAVSHAVPLAGIVDFDLSGDRAVFLGSRRDAAGRWAPEGAILWAGTLGGGLEDLAPRMYAESGSSATEMARCGALEIGAVRFLADGRYAVVPGVQPGAFLYAADDRLLQAWDTDSLGFYDHCDLDWRASREIVGDPAARLSWLNRQPILDDVLAWGEWPALVIRHPRSGGTAWRLVVLGPEGVASSFDLPVVTGSTGSRLRGDRRGDRLALLISEFGPPDEPPQEPPRLVVVELAEKP